MSGMKQMVINTQERAISTDINRLQKFKDRDFSEFFRYWLDVADNDDLTPGVVTEPNTLETPLRAEIINGLMVKPQTGSFDLLIDPGLVMLLVADGAADESSYKYVHDAGLSTPLTIAAGAVATRIDVVECRMNPVDVIVTDNRDIFNTTTGLFSASTVTKERNAQLEYRVRQGAAGGGMPANQSGWLPIMVASVPSTAASNNDCDFWDVRPLVADRPRNGMNVSRDMPTSLGGNAFQVGPTAPVGAGQQEGVIDFVDSKGRKLGGRLRSTTPGIADADYFDWNVSGNWESDTQPATNTTCYSYFLTPFGLPRWARYNRSGARLPQAPRGLVVLSTIGPTQRGKPSSAIALPTSTGLGGSTSEGVCFGQSRRAGGGGGANRAFIQAGNIQNKGTSELDTLAAASVGISFATFVPIPNRHFPQSAKAVWVRVRMTRTVATGTTETIAAPILKWFFLGSNANVATIGQPPGTSFRNDSGGPIDVDYDSGAIRIAIPSEYPVNTLTTPMLLQMNWSAGGGTAFTADTALIEIVSWEL